jgi:hypothetical protein
MEPGLKCAACLRELTLPYLRRGDDYFHIGCGAQYLVNPVDVGGPITFTELTAKCPEYTRGWLSRIDIQRIGVLLDRGPTTDAEIGAIVRHEIDVLKHTLEREIKKSEAVPSETLEHPEAQGLRLVNPAE